MLRRCADVFSLRHFALLIHSLLKPGRIIVTDPEQIANAEELLMRAAIRALMLSHPEPERLRECWNLAVSNMWKDAVMPRAGLPPGQSAWLRERQEVWESFLPSAGGS